MLKYFDLYIIYLYYGYTKKYVTCIYIIMIHISIYNLYLYPPTPPSLGILFLQITFLTFLGVIISWESI